MAVTESNVEKLLKKLNMKMVKLVSSSLAGHFKLSSKQSPSSEKERHDMEKVPCASAFGSLTYTVVYTRPDLAHIVCVVSKIFYNPGKEYYIAVKWIFRYLKRSSELCLCLGGGKPVLVGNTNADMASDIYSRKSSSCYLVTFAGAVY